MPNPETDNGQQTTDELGFNFAYLDEQTKRSIRRSLLKAVAIPGHQIHLVLERCQCPMVGVQVASRLQHQSLAKTMY
jgi:alpha-D-ribose 1-methylphosphonate 5-phosphate C-P lyase